jgi:hypothetical protein
VRKKARHHGFHEFHGLKIYFKICEIRGVLLFF